MNHFALTIVGRDRPGIVSQVTKILFDQGCNLADSSCSILGGQFAMILILGHPEFTSLESFGDAFKPLEDTDLTVALRVLKPGGETRSQIDGLVGTEERPVYVMVIEATLPEKVEEEDVNRWLAPVRNELQIDITVRTIPTVEL
jgi:glycine cleavage system transcriptional repressor